MEIDKETGKTFLHAGDTLKLTAAQVTMVYDALLKWEVYVRSMVRANDGKKFEKRWQDELCRLESLLSFWRGLGKNGTTDDAGDYFTVTLCVGMPPNELAVLDVLRAEKDHIREAAQMNGMSENESDEVNDDCVDSGDVSGGDGGAGAGAVSVPGAGVLSDDYCAVSSAGDGAGADGESVADADGAEAVTADAVRLPAGVPESVLDGNRPVFIGRVVGSPNGRLTFSAVVQTADGYTLNRYGRMPFSDWVLFDPHGFGSGPDALRSAIHDAEADAKSCESIASESSPYFWRYGVIDYRIFPDDGEGMLKVVLSQVGCWEFTIRKFRLHASGWLLSTVRELNNKSLSVAWDEFQECCRTLDAALDDVPADADCVALCGDPAAVDSEEWRGMGFQSSEEFEAYCASDERNADGSLMTAREWLTLHRMGDAAPVPAKPAVMNSRMAGIVSVSGIDNSAVSLSGADSSPVAAETEGMVVDSLAVSFFCGGSGGVYEMMPQGHGIVADSTDAGFAEGKRIETDLAAHGARFLTMADALLGRDAGEQSFYALPILWDPYLRKYWRRLVDACRSGSDDELDLLFADEKRWKSYIFGMLVSADDVPDMRAPDALYLRCACHLASALVGACTSTAIGGGLASVALLPGVEKLCDAGFADQIIFCRTCVRDGNRVTLRITREMVFRELWNGSDPNGWNRRNVTSDAGDRSALMRMCYGWQCPEAYDGYAYLCSLPCPICGASDSAAVSMMDSGKRHTKVYATGADAVAAAGMVGVHCLACGVVVPAEAYGAKPGDSVFDSVIVPHFNRWNVCRNAGIFGAVKGGAE